MLQQHKNSLLTAAMQSEAKMPKNLVLYGLIVICLTILLFSWEEKGSLCELRLRQGTVEFSAILAYESKR